MPTYKKYVITLGVALLLGFTFFSNGCKERDVPYIIDEEEITKYIEETNIGQQFFRRTNLINPDTFRITADPTSLYKIVVDSVKRTFTISASVNVRSFDFDFLGGVARRDADAEVRDRVYYKTVRISGIDTITTNGTTEFARYGWFAKVGDDSHPYAGWTLYGYNGGSPYGNMGIPTQVTIEGPNNYIVSGDSLEMTRFIYTTVEDTLGQPTKFAYALIIDTTAFLKIPGGVSIEASFAAYANSSYSLMTTGVDNVFQTVAMNRSGSTYNHSFMIPGDEMSHWYLMVFMDVRSTTIKIWCVPYRIWP